MRLWTLHPKHLDPAGLVALWRETLLAQAVLQGKTKGYKHHPQLIRFQQLDDPAAGVATYLAVIHEDAVRRGYNFDGSKIQKKRWTGKISETKGQLAYEWEHLERKLKKRNPEWHKVHHKDLVPTPHPMFRMVAGDVRDWEKV
ncbi:MAG TPA: DNA lyase [Fibrobacteres bacterium]|jgi:hypothetical protein|nr:DNA lyase [Fibrobacterota bacterium]